MKRARSLAALGLMIVVLLAFVNVGQVWALTISPDPPTEGQSFTITSNGPSDLFIFVYSGFGCLGGIPNIIAHGTSPSFTLTLTAGQYSSEAEGDSSGCVNFTVNPTAVPEYPYGFAILAIFIVLGYAIIKRKTATKN